MVQIVDAIADDVYTIRDVQKRTWLETYPNEELGITREDIEARFANESKEKIENRKKIYSDPDVHIWVAKDDGEIIGFCIARKEEKNNRIGAIYLLPSYQGQGVGGRLIEAALNWLGVDKDIYVNVASYNDNATRFYERYGFVKTEKDISNPVADLPSGKSIPETEMVRKSI